MTWEPIPSEEPFDGVEITHRTGMPRWASRLTLEILSVRVERVHQITYRDVLAEGITEQQIDHWRKWLHKDDAPAHTFGVLWDSLNAKRDDGKYAWAKNPWVWVIEFKRL